MTSVKRMSLRLFSLARRGCAGASAACEGGPWISTSEDAAAVVWIFSLLACAAGTVGPVAGRADGEGPGLQRWLPLPTMVVH